MRLTGRHPWGLRLIGLLCFVALCSFVGAQNSKSWFFIQLTDPQFGMYASDASFEQESANFEFAIATANRLKPAFVIVTGDLINKPGDASEGTEYLRIAAKLDSSIPLYNVPGNHDVGNVPTPGSVAKYTARFGPDHYLFESNGLVGIVLDSVLIHSPQGATNLYAAQEEWLKEELETLKKRGARQIVVFQHHPWFLESIDEADAYENIPRERRLRYLKLLSDYGVSHVFSGHYHRNTIARYGQLELVTTGPIGKPLGEGAKSGMRIVWVRNGQIEHHYYDMGNIPNVVTVADKSPN
jgi:3',5'-cyclic AMP phosphodiesterase CpdA